MKITISLIVLILLVEGGIRFWRHRELTRSSEPYFTWKDAELLTEAAPPFSHALNLYGADRGMEAFQPLTDGAKLQILYFEWDDMEAGPFSTLSGHEIAACNQTAGFSILKTRVPRVFSTPGFPSLEFHYTHLADPTGRPVHAYKLPWFQGLGAWQIHSGRDRSLRLQRSFLRHRGSARVVQLAVFGVTEEREAWEIVQRELRDHLEWQNPAQ